MTIVQDLNDKEAEVREKLSRLGSSWPKPFYNHLQEGITMSSQNDSSSNSSRSQSFPADPSRLYAPKVDLRGANLKDRNLQGAILRKANLRNADLSQCNLIGVDLSGADLRQTCLRQTILCKAQLTDCLLADTDFREALYDKNTLFPQDFDPTKAGMLLVEPPVSVTKRIILKQLVLR